MTKFLRVTALLVIMLTTSTTYAQLGIKKPGFTVGGNVFYAQPQDDLKNSYKQGFGLELKAGVGLGKTYLIATLGYTGYTPQSSSVSKLSNQQMKVGIKQYFLAKRLFVNGDIGVSYLDTGKRAPVITRFTSDIGAGVRLFGIEASIYYDAWNKLSGEGTSKTMQFKLGYNFTL